MMVRIVDIDITFIPIAQKDKGAMVQVQTASRTETTTLRFRSLQASAWTTR